MDLMEQIKKLAGGAADTVLQKFDSSRIGAEAERRGLFVGHVRGLPRESLTSFLRAHGSPWKDITDDELSAEFAARRLLDNNSYQQGVQNERTVQEAKAESERFRVRNTRDAIKQLLSDAEIVTGQL